VAVCNILSDHRAYLKRDFPEVQNFCRLKDDELLLSNDARDVKFFETKDTTQIHRH
jgi:hypothetical protein